ncbi:MAG: glycoside hydrolase family 97 protein [Bacteroidales bacterium]|nr:glycoside hydrolase family 97 protein [Bacteroidales bacterium]
MKRILTLFLLAALSVTALQAKIYVVSSPDLRTRIKVETGEQLTWSVTHAGQVVILPSAISMTVAGREIGKDVKVRSAKTASESGTVEAPFWRQASIGQNYNQLTLDLGGGWSVVFRAYDGEGVGYRFVSTSVKKGDRVTAEKAEFKFQADHTAYVPYSSGGKDNPYRTSFESQYTVAPISQFRSDEAAFSPLLVCLDNGVRVEITDSDIESYPGMFLRKGAGLSLKGDFAPVPDKVRETPARGQVVVDSYTDYLAVIGSNASKKQPRLFPWRLIAIADSDAGLPVNNLVYLTASPSRVADISWIRPGKVAWDWWNWWNITGVDFVAGINSETYKYYIDFASANNIEYVVLDEGWSGKLDIMELNPAIDLKELCRYARSKNVDLVLWAVSYVLDKDLEKACSTYSKMGVKGFKVDFMDRDDQTIPEQLYRIAEACARHRLFVDYHGMYKPAGMNRTWPNVLNFEGVWGLEQLKWSRDDMVSYDVTFPYIRMLSGPVDYTPGAMRNALQREYAPNNSNPMSQGTRSHQVAEYVVFDAPFEMLCDNPTAYMKEQETTDFISAIPTVWDETRVLQGEIGKYIVTARRKGNQWYIGGLNNWDARDITLDLSVLGIKDGKHSGTLYRDGVNATRNATDYKCEPLKLQTGKPLQVHMAPGGGFVLLVSGK